MTNRYRLGVLTTHPIQYQVPWFRALAARPDVDLTVLFCMRPDPRSQGDGFGVDFQWDVPLLDGYAYRVLDNRAAVPSVTRFDGCDTPGITADVRQGAFDALLVNGWVVKSCLQALAACRRLGVPCLVRGESNTLRRRAAWKRLVHRLLLRRYAACLAIGQLNREFYLAAGVPPSRIFWTPYGVDNARFAAAAAGLRGERSRLRREWGIPDDAFVPLFCGKLVPKKRPLDLLRAIPAARAATPRPIHVLVAGDGELAGECRRAAATLGVAATFAGFLNQTAIPRAYAAADCLVLPSDDGETWGLVVNEAMASGLPAVVSDQVGCHPDLIVPDATGQTYPMGDAPALGQRLGLLAANPALAAAWGARAARHVERYGCEAVVEGIVLALRAVAPRDTGADA